MNNPTLKGEVSRIKNKMLKQDKRLLIKKYQRGVAQSYSEDYRLTELNFEDGDSSPNLKVWVSSPWM